LFYEIGIEMNITNFDNWYFKIENWIKYKLNLNELNIN
jgi:hypothetical protein